MVQMLDQKIRPATAAQRDDFLGGLPMRAGMASKPTAWADLGFRDGENETSAFTAMRLLQAVRVAANLVRGGNQGDRRQLEDAYVATHGPPKPRLEFQGSDGYLKKQWRMIAKGELGYIPAKHIVSALPEEGERPSSTHKKITVDGWEREDDALDVHGGTATVWQPEGHQGGAGRLVCLVLWGRHRRQEASPERHHLAVRRAQCMAQDPRDGAPGHHSLRCPQEYQGRLPLLATGGL